MPFHNNIIAGASGVVSGGDADTGYKINRSVRFDADDTSHFSNNFSAGHANRQKFTFSFWAKFWGYDYAVLSAGTSSSGGYFELKYNGSKKLEIFGENITSTTADRRLTDPNAWYHICLVIDKGHSTATERAKIFVNGIRQTLSSTSQSNTSSVYWGHQSQPHRIGGRSWSSSDQGNFYIAEFHYLDGIVPGVSTDSDGSVTGEVGAQYIDEFIEWDSDGVLQPKEYTGSYGTYGTYLDFSDNSSDAALGHDASGSNDWTVNNLKAVKGTNNNSLSSFSHSGYTQLDPSSNFLDGDDSTVYRVVSDSSNSTTTAIFTLGTNVSGTAEVLFMNGNAQVTGRISIDGGANYTALPTQSASWYNLGNMNGNEIRIRSTFNSGGGSTAHFYGFRVGGTKVIATANTEVDSLIDSPTDYTATSGNNGGNYCILNRMSQSGSGTLRKGNLHYNLGSGTHRVEGSIAVKSGKFYWEAKAESGTTNGTVGGRFGITQATDVANPEQGPFSLGWHATAGVKVWQGSGTTAMASGTNYGDGDILGFALDADSSIGYFYKNGSLVYTVNFTRFIPPGTQYLTPVSWNGSSGTPVWYYDFGASGSFTYTPPTGFKSLCTKNLDPAPVPNPRLGFDILTWSGSGGSSNRTISGLKLSSAPDFVWSKAINHGYHNNLWDTIRGFDGNALITDYLGSANGGQLISANATSITTSNGVWYDQSGKTYAAWCWDAGTVTNPVGDIWEPGAGKYYGVKFPTASGGTISFGQTTGTNTVEVWTSSNNSNWTQLGGTLTLADGHTITTTNQYILFKNTANATLSNVYVAATDNADAHYSGSNHGPSGDGAWSGPGYTDYDFREPGGTMIHVGSSNSQIYRQDAAYANSARFSGDTSGVNFANMFNGIIGFESFTGAICFSEYGNGTNTTWTAASTITGITSLRIFVDMSGSVSGGAFEVNGNDYRDLLTQYMVAGNHNWVTIPETSLSSIKFGRNSNNNIAIGIGAVEVNGKILIDSGQTPPNVPSAPSICRANPTHGFSLARYVGTSSGGMTVGHNLNKTPEFYIVKDLSANNSWLVYHKEATAFKKLHLNDQNARQDTNHFDDLEARSTVFSIGPTGSANTDGSDYMAWVWAPIEGYSKFGSFQSGSQCFVYLGFTPRWILFKADASGHDWLLMDTDRSGGNYVNDWVSPNLSNAEVSDNATNYIDFVSNGFKVGGVASGGYFAGSKAIYYAAFASHPFRSARAR